jgi:SAM-dependent MidA family methyltransferase
MTDIEPLVERGRPAEGRPALPPSDPVLVERLQNEIRDSGPVTFARFMEIALVDPEHGYYATSEARPTRSGDFLTAPELHPIFGATIGRAIESQWQAIGRPAVFTLVEFGAGSGRLALDVLVGLGDRSSALLEAIRYRPIEVVEAKEAAILERLSSAGFGSQVATIPPSSRRGDDSATGVILANEFLDALPVHRVEQGSDGLRELFVGWSQAERAFVVIPGPPSTPALAERLRSENVALERGQQAEICLELDSWAAAASASVERGFAIILDYGAEAPELYRPDRRRGTLLAYSGHRVNEDPFTAIGRQDLTAHVDFTAISAVLGGHRWQRLGITTQATFLVASGLQDELAARRADPAMTPEG